VHEVLETEQFLGVADLTPLIAAVTGWVDLTDEGVADELDRLREVPGGSYLRAIRHGAQGEPDHGWLARPEVIDGVKAVGAAGLVYELLTIPPQLPAATSPRSPRCRTSSASCPVSSPRTPQAGRPNT
jgi:L-fuconolactonase